MFLFSLLPFVLGQNLILQQHSHHPIKDIFASSGSSNVIKSTITKTAKGLKGVTRKWTQMKHKSFPKYSIRVNQEAQLCDPKVNQITGYLDTEDGKHFFFWFFESRRNPSKDPLVLWLNGGPGCSSLTGLLMELGPCRVNPGGQDTTINKNSWNNEANVMFLDQPVGTGFSYTDGKAVSSTLAAAEDVYAFLEIFLSEFTKFSKSDFHITGESYAGHYIPAIATAITEGNGKVLSGNGLVTINLKSIAIGNGLTDPLVQYKYYPDMACDTKYGPVLEEEECDAMRKSYETCKTFIQACYKFQNTLSCVPSSIYCNNAMIGPFQKTGKNVYDIRTDCDPSNPLCYSILNDIEIYLNLESVQTILGVDKTYEGCTRSVNMKFLFNGDWMKPFVRHIPVLLEKGIQVLIYAGDADYICNWIGNKAWVTELEWFGSEGFRNATDYEWISKTTGKSAGEVRSYGHLTFIRVYNAGHMVPYDQPEHSYEMIKTWFYMQKK